MAWVGWSLIVAGLVMFGLVTFKWDLIKKSYRVRTSIKIFGESGAKIVYTISSVIMLVFGILITMGVL